MTGDRDDKLAQLHEIYGIRLEQARHALRIFDWDLQRATNWCFEVRPDRCSRSLAGFGCRSSRQWDR